MASMGNGGEGDRKGELCSDGLERVGHVGDGEGCDNGWMGEGLGLVTANDGERGGNIS